MVSQEVSLFDAEFVLFIDNKEADFVFDGALLVDSGMSTDNDAI